MILSMSYWCDEDGVMLIAAVLDSNAVRDSFEGGAKVGRETDRRPLARESEKKALSVGGRSLSWERRHCSASSQDLSDC